MVEGYTLELFTPILGTLILFRNAKKGRASFEALPPYTAIAADGILLPFLEALPLVLQSAEGLFFKIAGAAV
jgi:hypothetical protein